MKILFNNSRAWASHLALFAMRLVVMIFTVCSARAANRDTPFFTIRAVNNEIRAGSQEGGARGDSGDHKSKESENEESFHGSLKGP